MELPESCAAIDWYIGELEFIGRGIGPRALELFLDTYVFPNFDTVFVDPDTANTSAIRAYEKIGFTTISKTDDEKVTLMLKTKN
jgi:aminoglycoside 6'-N-acetyltransferase